MTPVVLDCSVTMAWCFEDECDRYADAVLQALRDRAAAVPSIWGLEVANVLLMAERRKRITAADAARFVELLAGLEIRVEDLAPDRAMRSAMAVGREYDLSSYDAAYLELAMRQGVPLATRDRALRAAARKAGVPTRI